MPYQAKGLVEESAIAAWEAHGWRRLPEDYRRFILRTNGGSVRPYTFELSVGDDRIGDHVHALNRFYDWAEVIEEMQEQQPTELRNPPPARLPIGCSCSELVLMLALDEAGYGEVEAWVKDYFNVWGKGGNSTVVRVAPSFSAFLDLLRPDERSETHHPFWARDPRLGVKPALVDLP